MLGEFYNEYDLSYWLSIWRRPTALHNQAKQIYTLSDRNPRVNLINTTGKPIHLSISTPIANACIKVTDTISHFCFHDELAIRKGETILCCGKNQNAINKLSPTLAVSRFLHPWPEVSIYKVGPQRSNTFVLAHQRNMSLREMCQATILASSVV